MSAQYQKLAEFPAVLWEKDSPVAVEQITLLRDTYRGTNVVQISFRNVCNTNIYGLSIAITMKDFSGRQVLKKDIVYNYHGIEVGINKTFGSNDYINVDEEAKSFLIRVTRAEFSEGASYRGNSLLKPMSAPLPMETLGEFAEPFTEKLRFLHPRMKIICAPENKPNFWRCCCGRFYPHSVESCPACKMSKIGLEDTLKAVKQEKYEREQAAILAERLRKKKEEMARKAEEERIRLEKEAEERRLAEEAEQKRLKKQRLIRRYTAALAAILLLFLLVRFAPLLKKAPEETTEAIETTLVAEEPTTEAPTEETTVAVAEVPELPTPIAILGQDLADEDKNLVLRLIGMKASDLEKFEMIYVTPEEESNYLSGKVDNSLLGGRSLSSLLITPTLEGSGLNIELFNITYCTEEMYREALLEAGITDADVIVAGPFKITGTAALAGIMKAGEHFAEVSANTETLETEASTEAETKTE